MSAKIRRALFARMRRDTPAQCERCNAIINPRYLDTHICLSLRPQLPGWTLDEGNSRLLWLWGSQRPLIEYLMAITIRVSKT